MLADEELRAADLRSLLRAAYSLTHRIHAARVAKNRVLELDLRAQRDLIDAEIERRCWR